MAKANHSAAQRWWRTLPDHLSVEQAQSGVDKLAARMDERRRTVGGIKVTVTQLASGERLLVLPVRPFPAELKVQRAVSPQAPVSLRRQPLLGAGRAVIARHLRAAPDSGKRFATPGMS